VVRSAVVVAVLVIRSTGSLWLWRQP